MEVQFERKKRRGRRRQLSIRVAERIKSLALMPSADNELIDFYWAYSNDYIVIALVLDKIYFLLNYGQKEKKK